MLLAAVLPAAFAQPAADEVARWQDAVVQVWSGPALCAGFLVDDRGTVATAYHCVVAGRPVRVVARDGGEGRGRVRVQQVRDDVALLDVPELARRPYLELRQAPVRVGEEVWAVGHPYGTEAERAWDLRGTLMWSVSRGVVSAVGEALVQVDTPVNPGNSGGPLVDQEGRVVGVASRKLDADNVAFMVPVERLEALLELPAQRSLGGTYGLELGAVLPWELGWVPTLEAAGALDVRDWLVVRVGFGLPVGLRWQTLAWGESHFVLSEGYVAGRFRLGYGRASTGLELGAGAAVQATQIGQFVEERFVTTTAVAGVHPAGVVRLHALGTIVRASVWYDLAGADVGGYVAVDLPVYAASGLF